MKHVLKSQKDEPASLKNYRKETPNASYSGYGDKNLVDPKDTMPPLKHALAVVQGFICCYCMARIDEARMSVEHYVPQKHDVSSPLTPEAHKVLDLDFMNMLGSCNEEGARNCSGVRGNTWLTIDPRKKECETLIRFDKNGIASASKEEIEKDIGTLDLNSQTLVQNRKAVIEIANARIRSIKEKGFYSVNKLEKEIDYWIGATKGKHFEYCLAAVHYLQSKMQKAS